VNLGAGDQLQDTVSCWAIGRSRTHCGICAPCLLRRISCETHGVADVAYKADVFEDVAAINDPRARDNLTHLVAFVEDLRELNDVELEYEYPDLMSGEPAMSLPRRLTCTAGGPTRRAPCSSSTPSPTLFDDAVLTVAWEQSSVALGTAAGEVAVFDVLERD
jgi:hypothetical protein